MRFVPRRIWLAAAAIGGISFGVLAWSRRDDPATNRSDVDRLVAEAAEAWNRDRAGLADRIAAQIIAIDPSRPEAWKIRLDRLRVLDRPFEALDFGHRAIRANLPAGRARRLILANTTLAVLAEVPDDESRRRLDRWTKADPEDFEARVAILARANSHPHPADPDRATRIESLANIVADRPDLVSAREALIGALADAGEVERGRETLHRWPPEQIDARRDRLKGRWDLEYDHQPARAAEEFARAIRGLPTDWKSRSGLSRALKAMGLSSEADQEARAVSQLRERLDPAILGPRLANALEPDAFDPADLAEICRSVGLMELAIAWSREVDDRQTGGPGHRGER